MGSGGRVLLAATLVARLLLVSLNSDSNSNAALPYHINMQLYSLSEQAGNLVGSPFIGPRLPSILVPMPIPSAAGLLPIADIVDSRVVRDTPSA